MARKKGGLRITNHEPTDEKNKDEIMIRKVILPYLDRRIAAAEAKVAKARLEGAATPLTA